mgnify:CR=1 FL=1
MNRQDNGGTPARSATFSALLPKAIRIVAHIIILLIIVQAITGILLSLHYVPDTHAAEVQARPGTIVHATQLLVGGSPKGLSDGSQAPSDTLALAGQHALVPAGVNDVVPSVAAASVNLTIEHHVVGGSVVRAIHHTNTTLLIVLTVILCVLLAVGRAWRMHPTVWVAVIIGLMVLMASAFTGRLLPDDVYSYVSASIVRHELSEFPLGSSLVTMLGLNASESARLSTPYAIHALSLPCFLAFGVCVLWRRWGRPSASTVLACALGVAFVVALSSLMAAPYYPVRDVSGAVEQSVSVAPWWPFVVPNAVVTWFGGELAGYLAAAFILALLLLPLYLRSSPSDS